MLKLRLGPDREPHCSRPGCDQQIGTIKVIFSVDSHDGEPARLSAEEPSWTEDDFGQSPGDHMRWRALLVAPGWRCDSGTWRRHRTRRPRMSPTNQEGTSYLAPYLAPMMPTVVECPGVGQDSSRRHPICKSRLGTMTISLSTQGVQSTRSIALDGRRGWNKR